MGSQQSSQRNNNNLIILSEHKQEPGLLNFKEYSSYKGVKSIVSSEKDFQQSTKDTYTNSSDKDKESNPDQSEILFKWTKGGNSVYMTGSFSNWKMRFLLQKDTDGNFATTLSLPRGRHFFKFIVDNDWLCSPDYVTELDDSNNLNNVIDTRQEKPTRHGKDPRDGKKRLKDSRGKSSYSLIYPEDNDLNSEAPPLPQSYSLIFNLSNNSRQGQIGNSEYMARPSEEYNHSNSSFRSIGFPPHVNL